MNKTRKTYLGVQPLRVEEWKMARELVKTYPKSYFFSKHSFYGGTNVQLRFRDKQYIKTIAQFIWYKEI